MICMVLKLSRNNQAVNICVIILAVLSKVHFLPVYILVGPGLFPFMLFKSVLYDKLFNINMYTHKKGIGYGMPGISLCRFYLHMIYVHACDVTLSDSLNKFPVLCENDPECCYSTILSN